MAKFVPGTDVEVRSKDPLLEVLASRSAPLKPGKHVFSLVVGDDAGNSSDPARITIIVADDQRPTAVLDFINADGKRIPDPEVKVRFGEAFRLSAERSSDSDGEIVAFQWVLKEA